LGLVLGVATGNAYIVESNRSAVGLLHILKKLLFVSLWHTKRSGVDNIAKILVQGFGNEVQIILPKSEIPFSDEFGLGGIEIHSVSHQDEANEGGPL
jgi:hypothetical protein